MGAQYNADEIDRLVREAREDDAGMTPGPWEVRGGINGALFAIRPGADRHYETLSVTSTPDYGCNLRRIARTRNSLRAMADQLEAARAEVAYWRADAERLATAANQNQDEVDRMRPVFAAAVRWRTEKARMASHLWGLEDQSLYETAGKVKL